MRHSAFLTKTKVQAGFYTRKLVTQTGAVYYFGHFDQKIKKVNFVAVSLEFLWEL